MFYVLYHNFLKGSGKECTEICVVILMGGYILGFNYALLPAKVPHILSFFKTLSSVFQSVSLAGVMWLTLWFQLSIIIHIFSQTFLLNSRSILFKWTLSISTWKSHRHLNQRVQTRFISFPS